MRQGTSSRRPRSRGNNSNNQRRGNSSRTKVYDSNGPDVRIRGTAHQVAEKYMTLSKDATSMGELILAESYLQHAEHYQRIINNLAAEVAAKAPQSQQNASAPVKTGKPENTDGEKDNLSLPASILGGEVEVKTKGEMSSSKTKNDVQEVAGTV